jgi:hypothetical protein
MGMLEEQLDQGYGDYFDADERYQKSTDRIQAKSGHSHYLCRNESICQRYHSGNVWKVTRLPVQEIVLSRMQH